MLDVSVDSTSQHVRGVAYEYDLLYKLSVMVFKLRLDKPISPPVDTAVGKIFSLEVSIHQSTAP